MAALVKAVDEVRVLADTVLSYRTVMCIRRSALCERFTERDLHSSAVRSTDTRI